MISPLLHKTGWHEYVAQNSVAKDIAGWHQLVALPTAQDTQWKGLREAVKVYFNKAVNLIACTDKLVLKCLNSPDPSKK